MKVVLGGKLNSPSDLNSVNLCSCQLHKLEMLQRSLEEYCAFLGKK